MEHAVCEYPPFPETDTPLFFFGTASAAWLADDWSKSGVYGDATLGSAEKGHALIETTIANLGKLITHISRLEIPYKSADSEAA